MYIKLNKMIEDNWEEELDILVEKYNKWIDDKKAEDELYTINDNKKSKISVK